MKRSMRVKRGTRMKKDMDTKRIEVSWQTPILNRKQLDLASQRQETGVTSVSRLTRAIVSTESHFTKNLQALTAMVAMVVMMMITMMSTMMSTMMNMVMSTMTTTATNMVMTTMMSMVMSTATSMEKREFSLPRNLK